MAAKLFVHRCISELCGYVWKGRKEHPKECPKCKRRQDKNG